MDVLARIAIALLAAFWGLVFVEPKPAIGLGMLALAVVLVVATLVGAVRAARLGPLRKAN